MRGQRTPRPIPIEAAKQAYAYNPLTGVFTNRKTGKERIAKSTRVYLSINGQNFPASRVAWAVHFGKDPLNVIDHINQNPLDNRIVNLRDVTQAENLLNVAPEKRRRPPRFRTVVRAIGRGAVGDSEGGDTD